MFTKKMLLVLVVLTALFTACSSNGVDTTRGGQTSWKLAWSDEFDADSIDRNKWDFDIGNGFSVGDGDNKRWISGWGNNELEYYTDRTNNAYLENGELVIKAIKEEYEGFKYTSAKLKSTFSQRYGRFEIRAKLPAEVGLWPAIWMLSKDNAYGGWPASGEIDIMEARGGINNVVSGTIHYGGPDPKRDSSGEDYTFFSGETIDTFHVYAFEWTPGEMRWYVDNTLFYTENFWYSEKKDSDTHELNDYPAPFDKPFFLIMNLAVGGDYGGAPDASSQFPAEMRVDYVRMYTRTEYSPAGARPPGDFYWTTHPEDIRPALRNGNLVYNGGFDWTATSFLGIDDDTERIPNVANSYYWTDLTDTDSGGEHTVQIKDGVYRMTIVNEGGVFYSNQLIQAGLYLEKDYEYKVTFDAWSDKARTIHVKLGAGAERSYVNFSGDKYIDIGTAPPDKPHGFSFDMLVDSHAKSRLEFNFGTIGTGDIFLDNVSVVKLGKIEARASLSNGNLVYNGGFDGAQMNFPADSTDTPESIPSVSNSDYWFFHSQFGKATPTIENNKLKVSVMDWSRANDWDVNVLQRGLSIQKGNTYKVSFTARASDPRTITALVGGGQDKGYKRYGEDKMIELTTNEKPYTFEFTMAEATNHRAMLQFLLADGTGDYIIYLDDVVVKVKEE